jgi:hypothetical protein
MLSSTGLPSTWEWTSGSASRKDKDLLMSFDPGADLGTSNRYAGSPLLADVTADLLRDGAPVLVRNPNGHISALWAKDADPFGPQMGSRLVVAEFDGTAWGEPQTIPGTLGLNNDLDATVDGKGHLLVVWGRSDSSAITTNITFDDLMALRDTNDLYYSSCVGGVWSLPARLAATPGRDGDVDLASTSEGKVQVQVAWSNSAAQIVRVTQRLDP